MKNIINIDLSQLKLYGDVLDLGCKNGGVIYRVLKNQYICFDNDEAAITVENPDFIEDFNWLGGKPDNLPFDDFSFDVVTVFFSFFRIKSRKAIDKTVREIKRVLKKGGKLYIWDINILTPCFYKKLRINTKLPDNEVSTLDVRSWFQGKYDIDAMIPIIQKYLILRDLKDMGEYFYIEASK